MDRTSGGLAVTGKSYDAIVVGSGAGGASLALKLCQRGLTVLLLERGGQLGPYPYVPGEPVGRLLTEVHGDRSKPIDYLGGLTKFYGSALYRFRESDFEEVTHEQGVSPAWPFPYSELEPYYLEGERAFRVHGSPAGDLTDPPRSAPYPHPPLPHAPIVADLAQRLERTGTKIAPIPRGIDFGEGRPCVLCSTCDQYYCTLDAKMDSEIAALRPAMATGRLTILTHADCRSVLTNDAGTRVTGVRLTHGGEDQVILAPVVAVSTGLQETPALLRRSRTEAHPEGLGNEGGALGRYMAGHSTGLLFVLRGAGFTKMPAMHTKTLAINQFYQGAPDWPYPLGVIQIAGQMPFWLEASRWMQPVAKAVGQRSILGFYMTEALPTRETGLRFDGDRIGGRVEPVTNSATFRKMRKVAIQAFRQAGYRVLARERAPYIWHETGTARMGLDPETSVVTPDLQVHGIEGLFVVDASVLPTAGAVNTGLTIIALALRLGDHIAAGRDAAATGRADVGSEGQDAPGSGARQAMRGPPVGISR